MPEIVVADVEVTLVVLLADWEDSVAAVDAVVVGELLDVVGELLEVVEGADVVDDMVVVAPEYAGERA